jgi:tetratricopeptide (TPR) repeat protein
MSRPLLGAAALLLVAACSRGAPKAQPAPAAPAPEVAAPADPQRGAGAASAPRLSPGPRPKAVRPRPAPCLPDLLAAGPEALAEEARRALEAGRKERALDCSEEAVRQAPRLPAALSVRADALAALDRLDEARLAYARALALDPDDPVALLGAAELYVRRLSGDRDALEAGLAYALRGARAALRPPHRDRGLAADLWLVAGMAENDLGQNRQALSHLDRALAAFPDDPDAAYERGVALYELCRFDEAQRAFERTLKLSPDDPWALHQLALLAERRGDGARAEELFARARRIEPGAFPADLPVGEADFRAQVERTVAALSPDDRRALEEAPLELRDLPDVSDLRAVDPPLSPAILGLYRGPPEDEPCGEGDGPRCRSIVLYRKNLVRFAHDRAELDEQVRVTLLHELGHLRGEDDDELRDRGLE